MYARIHGAFVEQPFSMVSAVLIASAVVFAVLTPVIGDLADDWRVLLYQIVGAALLTLALYRHENGQPGARFLIFVGALGPIYFLYSFVFLIGIFAVLIWGIAFLASFVA